MFVLSLRSCAGPVAVLVALAGCGGSRSPVPSTASTVAISSSKGVVPTIHSSTGSEPLIYVFGSFESATGLIMDYNSGKIVTAFDASPFLFLSTCSDSQGDVFLGGTDATTSAPIISEYAYGATVPFASATIGSSHAAVKSCSIDPATGDVAALIAYASSAYAVAVFPSGLQSTPQLYQDSSIRAGLSVGYDASSDLFLLGTSLNSTTHSLAELPRNSTSFESLALKLGSHAAQVRVVQWDGQRVSIEGAYSPKGGKVKDWREAVYRLDISGSSATVAQIVRFPYQYKDGADAWIAPSLSSMILTRNWVRKFNYPQGGKESAKFTIPTSSAIGTIALPPSR